MLNTDYGTNILLISFTTVTLALEGGMIPPKRWIKWALSDKVTRDLLGHSERDKIRAWTHVSWFHSYFPDTLASQEGHSVRLTSYSHDLACVWKQRGGKEGHREASSSIFSILVSERKLHRRWVSSSLQRWQSMICPKIHRFFFFFLSRRMWDFVCDLTVTPTGYSKQNKLMTSIIDLNPKEELQGDTFKWPPYALVLVIAK